MKPLSRLLFACCLLPLLCLAASAQPAQNAVADGTPTAAQSRIEAESQPVQQAAKAVVDAEAATKGNAAAGATNTDTAPAGTANNAAASNASLASADTPAKDAEEGDSMQSDPLMIILLTAAAAYIFLLWRQDYHTNQAGAPNKGAFPGATPATAKAVAIAVVGSLILLAAETGGEIALGISAEQSSMTVLMLLSITAAAFFEELIFRGYLVVSNKGRALLVGSIVGFSVLFAMIHPFLWDITTPEGVPGWQIWNADWQFHFDSVKAWFSTCFVLVNSLWFYAMRFASFNPARSLIPCIAAHLAMNWGVFLIKLAQGHVNALY